jgi:protein O-GlcNAc transferase
MDGSEAKLRRALLLQSQGNIAGAERIYREVLAAAPSDTNALNFLGLLESERGNKSEGLALIEQAIASAPANAPARYNRAGLLFELGRLGDALAEYGEVLKLSPDPSVLSNRGAVFAALGRHDMALIDYDAALALNPRNAQALANRGNSLLALERSDDALASYDAAFAAGARGADIHFGRANALRGLGRGDEAITAYETSLKLDANRAEAHAHRAQLLYSRKRLEEALAGYDAALALNPALAIAHERRASILFELKRGEEAFAAYDSAFAADPALPDLEGARLLTKLYLCDWRNVREEKDRLIAHVREGRPCANPFAFLSAGISPKDELACAKGYANRQYPAREPLWRGENYRHRNIRLGYVSGEFREQATAYLTAGLFESHDRKRFELHAFATGLDDASPMRARIKAAFDSFSDLKGTDDRGIATAIRDAEIDILVNLNGFFGEERTGVAAYKPAPVQVNYLGYPGTMGAPYMDYIIADRILIPEDERLFYSEAVVHLPDCYQANDRLKSREKTLLPRASFGLPEHGLVFASFNNAYKITPEMFDVWMRLLRAAEDSVLWQLQLDPAASRNLRNEAARRGVAPERIVFAPFLPQTEHLARLSHADLFLDTVPVNAHTTASDTLWCGVPVLTFKGRTFAGRVAASLLEAAGLAGLVARSLDEYEAKALAIARDKGALAALKERLAENRDVCPLFDTKRLARHIETAYGIMHERREKGLLPEGFAVPGT